ncbi:MAG TPA: hypothetical protein VGG86_07635 [Roseiarcus sp.]|jgi:hypothetical protein
MLTLILLEPGGGRRRRAPDSLTTPRIAESASARNAGVFVLASFSSVRYRPAMPDDEKLTPAAPADVADSISFALRWSGRKRVHDSDALAASIAADRIVRHLERCGYVLMKRSPLSGSAPPNVPPGWPHSK